MDHVVEIGKVTLASAKGNAFEVSVNVAGVVKYDSSNVIAQQRKAKLDRIKELGVSA
jgi:hypothetical protein